MCFCTPKERFGCLEPGKNQIILCLHGFLFAMNVMVRCDILTGINWINHVTYGSNITYYFGCKLKGNEDISAGSGSVVGEYTTLSQVTLSFQA